jgi:hypothetical protein
MDKQLHTHWLNLISPLFPDNSEITSEPTMDEFLVSASWLLNNDPAQPNKRSRTVVIEIPKDTIYDYSGKTDNRKIDDDKKLCEQIKEFLHLLNPNHNTPENDCAPEVRLVACGSVLDS